MKEENTGSGQTPEPPPVPPQIQAAGGGAAGVSAASSLPKRAVVGNASLACVLAALAVFLLMVLLKPG